MESVNEQMEKENEFLVRLSNISSDTKIIGDLLTNLVNVYKILNDDVTRSIIRESIKLLGEGGVIINPHSKKEIIEQFEKNDEEIHKNINQLNISRQKIIEIITKIEALLLRYSNPFFSEDSAFFWSGSEGDNISKLVEVMSDFVLIIKSCNELKAIIIDIERHIHADKNYYILINSFDLFFSSLGKLIAHANELFEKKKDIAANKDFLMQTALSVELNKNLFLINGQFIDIKRLLSGFVGEIDSCIDRFNSSIIPIPIFIDESGVRVIDVKKDKDYDPRILMLTHEFLSEGGVATVTRKLSKYLTRCYSIDVIERSIKKNEAGMFRYYENSVHSPSFSFNDMCYFFNKYPHLNLSLVHIQSINFASGKNHWNNGGLDEIKNLYHNIPCLCTCHSFVRYEAEINGHAPWVEYSRDCQDETISLSNKFIVLHEFGRKQLFHYYKHLSIRDSDVFVIPNGIELHHRFIDQFNSVKESISRVFSPDRVNIIYIGRLCVEKGLTELIQAMPYIADKYSHVRLIVVGDYNVSSDYHAKLVDFLRKQGKEHLVEWLGFIKEEDQLEKVYKKYNPDIAILPSYHESFPLFALEAVSNGVPLIVTDCDGPREIYRPFKVSDDHDGSLRKKDNHDVIENPLPGIKKPLAIAVDPKNYESIVESVFWVLEHPKEVHSILKNAMIEIKEKYNWEAIGHETSKLYDSMISNNSFISAYNPGESSGLDIDFSSHVNLKKDNVKIGVIGHFQYSTGIIPDGVARWNETLFSYLRQKKYNVEGYAFVGDERNNSLGRVHFYDPEIIADKLNKGDMDIAIIHAASERAISILDSCKKQGIKTIFFMPYWGVWQGTFDFAKRADILVTGTQDYATKLRAKTRRDCRFVPFPIDSSFWHADHSSFIEKLKPKSWPKDTFNITYVGRLGSPKKVHKMIRPFKEFIIDKGIKDIRLIIAGTPEGNMGVLVSDEIKKYGLDEYVVYHNNSYTSEEVRAIYNSSDVFIFPSSFETYGQSNLEAISCGVPTVVPGITNFGNYAVPSMANMPNYPFAFKAGYLYDDKGNLREDGTPHDWENCFTLILWIYHNQAKAKNMMGKWSKFIKDNMSTEVIGNLFEKIIADVLKK